MMEAEIHQLHPTQEAKFQTFWLLTHPDYRSDKGKCKRKWLGITGNGLQTRALDKTNGTYEELDLYNTPDDLIEAMKAYRYHCSKNNIEPKFMKRTVTWLNGGFWVDLEDDQADLAANWDRVVAHGEKMKREGKL